MATWKAYIDDSGTHEESTFITAGVVIASASTWRKLLPRWEAILKEFDIKKYHAAAFNNRVGYFRKLSGKDQLACHMRLIGILSQVSLQYMAHTIRRSEFNLALKQLPPLKIEPFDYLLDAAIPMIARLGNAKRNISEIRVIVAPGRKLRGKIYQLYSREAAEGRAGKITHVGVCGESKCAALQVADLIAYESYKHAINISRPPDFVMRKSFQKIIAGNPTRSYLHGSVVMQKLLSDMILRFGLYDQEGGRGAVT